MCCRTDGARAAFALLCCVFPGCSSPDNIREEPVRLSNGAISLAGTLVLPAGRGPYPAVVLFHGSGPQARDLSTARWFAQQGVAALAYDKRGVGESSGDFRQVAFPELCGDGLAGFAMLKSRPDIQARKIGVWGISQGGWLGPLAAARSKDVAFVIAVSGPGVTPGEQMIFYYANRLRHQGFLESEVAEASAVRRVVWDYLATGSGYAEVKEALTRARSRRWFQALGGQEDGLFAQTDKAILNAGAKQYQPWFRSEMNYDPTKALREISVPILFVFGDADDLVPVPASVDIIRRTLADSYEISSSTSFPAAIMGSTWMPPTAQEPSPLGTWISSQAGF